MFKTLDLVEENPVRPSEPTTGTMSSNLGTSGGVSVGPSAINPDGAPVSIAGNQDDASVSQDGSPQGTHVGPQGTHEGSQGRPQGSQGRPITNPGSQEETPVVPGGILGGPQATPTGPEGSHAA